jgi:hypothetical protein
MCAMARSTTECKKCQEMSKSARVLEDIYPLGSLLLSTPLTIQILAIDVATGVELSGRACYRELPRIHIPRNWVSIKEEGADTTPLLLERLSGFRL